MRTAIRFIVLALSLLATGAGAWQPTRSITAIVGLPPTSQAYAVLAILKPKLEEKLGQTIVIKSVPGAFGVLAARELYNSPADGHTIELFIDGQMGIMPVAYEMRATEPLLYDPTEFAPVTLIAYTRFMLVVRPDFPIRSITELVEYTKAHPDELSFGSATPSSKLGIAILRSLGAKVTEIPYWTKPESDVFLAMRRGDVHAFISSVFSATPNIQDGTVRAIAVMGAPTRSAIFPDVPTTKEQGFGQFDFPIWWAFYAPPRTPDDIVNTYHAAIVSVMNDPEVRGKFEALDNFVHTSTPSELRSAAQKQYNETRQFMRDNKVYILGEPAQK